METEMNVFYKMNSYANHRFTTGRDTIKVEDLKNGFISIKIWAVMPLHMGGLKPVPGTQPAPAQPAA